MFSTRYLLGLPCSLLLLFSSALLAQNTVVTSSEPIAGNGSKNVLIGPDNIYSATFRGSYNVFSGYQAGQSNTTGAENVFTGSYSGNNNSIGSHNVFTGTYAGYSNTTGYANVFTGYEAGKFNATGHTNVFTGVEAGKANTDGRGNVFIGAYAGGYNTTGLNNVFTGLVAGRVNTTGRENVFLGGFTGYSNTTGIGNLFTGFQAGFSNTTGGSNVFTGFQAGLNNKTGSFNTYLGIYADATGANKDALQRATALGNNALVGINDGLVLGDTIHVKVGIGTAYPNERFTLRGNMNFVAYDNSMMLKNQPFLHFNEHESLALGLGAEIPIGTEKTLVLGSDEMTVQIPSLLGTYLPHAGQYLTVNKQGKLILAQPRVQVASVADWSDKVFEEDYALRPLGEVEDFVKKNKHLPGVPSAEKMVAEGMEATAFNAKLLEKIEELTLYVVALEKKNEEVKILREEVAELRSLIQRSKSQTPPK
ncbi:hypothetical protein [Salmonirosea aquatica]|uniref:TMF family protein n=1 Tax=Salmonirosea aquatica TaxID=2654236 RepID=A0A7C9FZ86_9BACT|nr:hypothetical protein [Cytophagaceae bacterium SJW1-29]